MRADLLTGTVTFFFSDIEGSTRLAQRMGPAFRQLIDQHNAIVRSAIASADATEVRTVGDSFFLVFAAADEAVGCAVHIQQELEAHSWPEEAAVRVRIGLHTGKGELGGDDYVGVDVHRAARIADAGHGGQVLVSEATRLLIGDGGFGLRDLGVHRLRGLERPEHLTQVMVPSLPAEFPPLRTESARWNNLPASTTALVGREPEVAAIGRLLEDHRVVTLLGPGGIGKTRLAIAAAAEAVERFADGVVFVDLSGVSDADLVPGAIADAVMLEESSLEAAVDHLGPLELLLVLDNFEQVVAAAPSVATLLASAPRLTTLVTSQAPLNVPGEQRYPVGPLTTDGGSGPGIEMFFARAGQVDPSFDGDVSTVARIVEALDGLPLAVELAASRAHVLPLDEIMARVEDPSFLVRTGAGIDRQRSLNAALWWSHDLLPDAERVAFRRLGAFSGGMTIAAAESVVGGDGGVDPLHSISDLVDRSLLQRSTDGSGRLVMLDGVRRFALERLEESGEGIALARHTDWFCSLAAESERGVRSDRAKWWRARLQSDLANIRAVLDRLLAAGDAERGLTLLGDIWRFMQSAGHLTELDRRLGRFLGLPAATEQTAGRVKGLMAQGAVRYWRTEAVQAIECYDEAVAIARRLDDAGLLAEALLGLGTSNIVAQREDEAIIALDESELLSRASGDVLSEAGVLGAKLFYRLRKDGPIGLDGEFQAVEQMETDAGQMAQVVQAKYARAGLAVAERRYQDARALALEGLAIAEDLADRYMIAWGLEWQAMAEVELGETTRAGMLIGAGERARQAHGGGWSPAVLGVADAPTRLRAALGDEAAEAAIAAGRELSLEAGLDIARRHD
jgi:predicted ATPase/class 3 adenylate cyclase